MATETLATAHVEHFLRLSAGGSVRLALSAGHPAVLVVVESTGRVVAVDLDEDEVEMVREMLRCR